MTPSDRFHPHADDVTVDAIDWGEPMRTAVDDDETVDGSLILEMLRAAPGSAPMPAAESAVAEPAATEPAATEPAATEPTAAPVSEPVIVETPSNRVAWRPPASDLRRPAGVGAIGRVQMIASLAALAIATAGAAWSMGWLP